MDVYEAIYTTRAMRRLSSNPVPDEVLSKLFDAAIRGPSSGTQQKFRFVCITDEERRRLIQSIYRNCLTELNETRYLETQQTVTTGNQQDPAVQQIIAIDASAQWLANNLHLVPVLVFAFGHPGGETTTFPCLWNFCLAARAEGLGTVITTLLKIQKDRVENLIGLPENGPWEMQAMVPVGYPLGNWGIAKRNPAHESVYLNSWGNPVNWTIEEPLWP